MKKLSLLIASISVIAGCTQTPEETDYNAEMLKLFEADFTSKGAVTLERVMQQDDAQKLCSTDEALSEEVQASIRDGQMQTVKYPADGVYLGSWEEGAKIANNGKGGQFSDEPGSVNGGNCYGCHEIDKEEVAFGTIGPSLNQYGKLRGNSEEIMKYTWAKIYNAQAFIACSTMPRFGHANILTEQQIKDVMALLLDPASPVNQ